MNIVQKIRASIQAVHGSDFPVYYHDEPTLNLMADGWELPCAFVVLITSGNATIESAQVKETVTAAVYFVDESEFDFDADANEDIIDACKERGAKWILGLSTDEHLQLDMIERTQRVYERFDAILTGYAYIVRLKERQGITDC